MNQAGYLCLTICCIQGPQGPPGTPGEPGYSKPVSKGVKVSNCEYYFQW